MSDNNNKKNKDIEGFDIMGAIANANPKDLNELLEWMASPRVCWENFEATVAIKKRSEIKWFALKVAEA